MTYYVEIVAPLAAIILIFIALRRKRLPLPPGPKPRFLVGNTFDVPSSCEWKTYAKWSQDFGSDILYLSVGLDNLIILNSFEVSDDLLEKRSAIYSDRPPFTMLRQLIGMDWNLGFMPYNSEWKEGRRMMHEHLNVKAAQEYRPQIMDEAHEVCRRLLENPDKFMEHLRHMAGAIVLYVGYGIKIQPHNDPYIDIAEKALFAVCESGNPGSYLVDTFPLLRHVPSWLPGAGFKRQAREWRIPVDQMAVKPLQFVKDNIANGTAIPSFSSKFLERMEGQSDKDKIRMERVIKSSAGTLYTAGSDTTISAIGTFFLAMTLYPEAQKKAQRELDQVFNGRLPEFFSDESGETLPYVDALIKETFRWQLVTPLAIPHRLMQDDVYKGYFLPKGSIVIPNAWAMLHDENVYSDPHSFIPERFLTKDGKPDLTVKDPTDAALGFGRRVCPGKHIAAASVWSAVVSVLSTFDIAKAKDDNGNLIVPSTEFTSGLVSYPEPFKCDIKPRSHLHESLIRDLYN